MVFTPYCHFKPTNDIQPESPSVYTGDKILYLRTLDKIHLQCYCINAFINIGVQQCILYSFVLDKPPEYKLFCQPETIHYKKNNQIRFEHYNILLRK